MSRFLLNNDRAPNTSKGVREGKGPARVEFPAVRLSHSRPPGTGLEGKLPNDRDLMGLSNTRIQKEHSRTHGNRAIQRLT